MRRNLTDTLIERTGVPEKGRQRFLRDRLILHLAVRFTAGGVRSFVWEGHTKDGTHHRETLGRWPTTMSLEEARAKAQEINVAVAAGRDPFSEADKERAARKADLMFRDMVEEFFSRHVVPQRAIATVQDYRNSLQNHIPPSWWDRKLSSFTAPEITELHSTVGNEVGTKQVRGRARQSGGKIAANRLVAVLRCLFGKAIKWGRLSGPNPAMGVDFFKRTRRRRFYNHEELARIVAALGREPLHYKAYFTLTMILGTRKTELLEAKWEWVDFRARVLTLRETKNGEPNPIALPDYAIALLKLLPSLGKHEYLFPSLKKPTGHMASVQPVWLRIKNNAGIEGSGAVIHTLRHTLASRLGISGQSPQTIQKALNHASLSTTEIYTHLSIDPVRAALEQNVAQMDFLPPLSSEAAENPASEIAARLVH